MINLISTLKSRFTKAETHPATENLADALKRLNTNDDFQMFRWWLKALYADAAHDIINAPADAVDIIRGRMSAYDQIFQLTSMSGIDVIRKEPQMQKQISDMLYGEFVKGAIPVEQPTEMEIQDIFTL